MTSTLLSDQAKMSSVVLIPVKFLWKCNFVLSLFTLLFETFWRILTYRPIRHQLKKTVLFHNIEGGEKSFNFLEKKLNLRFIYRAQIYLLTQVKGSRFQILNL